MPRAGAQRDLHQGPAAFERTCVEGALLLEPLCTIAQLHPPYAVTFFGSDAYRLRPTLVPATFTVASCALARHPALPACKTQGYTL